MVILKVIGIGAEAAVVLSPEALEILKAKIGDELRLEATGDGEAVLAPNAPDPQARLERGRAFIRKYQPTFEALAK